ncbi:MAG: hypothetical protein OXI37_07895 [Gammaproteobacteria bacterium]|nr:hypothetical protein [Gammaproteobacteria bacterium]
MAQNYVDEFIRILKEHSERHVLSGISKCLAGLILLFAAMVFPGDLIYQIVRSIFIFVIIWGALEIIGIHKKFYIPWLKGDQSG